MLNDVFEIDKHAYTHNDKRERCINWFPPYLKRD